MLQVIKSGMSKRVVALAAVCVSLLLAACGPPDTLSDEQIIALEDRVYARWQTKIARDFKKTWEFATPAYRAVFPRHFYPFKYSYTVEWELTGIEVLDYDRDAAVASVSVRVMSKPTKFTSSASRAVGAVPVTMIEQWILIDGQWWYSARS
jgi:hypothetical protein